MLPVSKAISSAAYYYMYTLQVKMNWNSSKLKLRLQHAAVWQRIATTERDTLVAAAAVAV